MKHLLALTISILGVVNLAALHSSSCERSYGCGGGRFPWQPLASACRLLLLPLGFLFLLLRLFFVVILPRSRGASGCERLGPVSGHKESFLGGSSAWASHGREWELCATDDLAMGLGSCYSGSHSLLESIQALLASI